MIDPKTVIPFCALTLLSALPAVAEEGCDLAAMADEPGRRVVIRHPEVVITARTEGRRLFSIFHDCAVKRASRPNEHEIGLTELFALDPERLPGGAPPRPLGWSITLGEYGGILIGQDDLAGRRDRMKDNGRCWRIAPRIESCDASCAVDPADASRCVDPDGTVRPPRLAHPYLYVEDDAVFDVATVRMISCKNWNVWRDQPRDICKGELQIFDDVIVVYSLDFNGPRDIDVLLAFDALVRERLSELTSDGK